MTHATLPDNPALPGAAIRAMDWAATALGPLDSWPAVLRTAFSLILPAPVPMAILWGEEGLLLYNDGYAVISGERHPGLLGSSVISGWPEAAEFNRNVVESGLRGESLSYRNQPFVLMRGGKPAEAWFDLNYSPIFDEQGQPAGVLAIVVETTGSMLEERRRRESEARFQLALNAGAVIGTWDWDIPADRFTADQRFASYFSLDQEAAAGGLPISVAIESIHPDDRDRVAGLIEAATASGGPYRAEYRVRHLDGEYRWIEANGHCDLGRDGTPLRFPGVLIDIDERKRTEAALRQSEAQLRAIFDTLPVGIVFAEVPSGKITGGNARVEQILGHPVLPSPSADEYGEWIAYYADGRLVPVEDYPLYVAVTTGAVTEREFHYQRGDGRRAWIRVIGGPVLDEAGAIAGAVITIIDIDREKQAEAQLNQLNQRLEGEVRTRTRERDNIWQMSHDLLGIADETGVWHSVSPAWERTLGWSEAEIVGRTSAWIEHPEDHGRTRDEVEALAGGAVTHEFHNRFRHRDGSYRWLSWSAAPKDGLLYCVARDITEEKQRRAELERAQAQLRQAQKMEAIGQLTGGIAHDFNNLLTSIIGGLDMLQRQITAGKSDRIERYMKLATSSAKRAAALTHRLLAFSRKQNLDMAPTDANALVRSMEDLLRRTLGERVELLLWLEEPLREALTDANLLENALLNLCINARDAMPDGGRLTIETAAVALDLPAPGTDEDIQPGSYVVLSVSDTGSGM
ncbi:MAG TPA: PAS domain S-box protein, partial [Herpetosiphonaceae bacterium]